MDITGRLNLLMIILVVAICGFVIKETVYKTRAEVFHEEDAAGKAQMDYSKSFTSKVLSLSEDTSQPSAPQPGPVLPHPRTFILAPSGLQPAAQQQQAAPSVMPLPAGFNSATTNAYLIYRETLAISDKLKDFLSTLRGNFVLDILPFSMTSDFSRIFLMMFRSRDRYTNITAQPQWSVAATDLDKQAIYIMETDTFKSNLVHEMTHIYFDGFFKPVLSPLWMSEGFAVRMQTSVENDDEKAWLTSAQKQFSGGKYIIFNDFISAKDLGDYNAADALNWYAQAYSVVDYLLRDKTRDEFYQFSKNLKSGMPLEQAMYRAYGMPFNTVRALEYAWLDNLQRGGGR